MNPHLLKDLTERVLWNEEMKNQIIAHNGSIQVSVRGQEEAQGFLCVCEVLGLFCHIVLLGCAVFE